mmetsp:Transcript_2528/g.3531  ORF Transcript_2528/g.3531 Transcript_2528/m.3531 type:complete len:379 (+) Transcript_2528:121-1257(+)
MIMKTAALALLASLSTTSAQDSCFANSNIRVNVEEGTCSGQEYLEGLQVAIDNRNRCDSDAETEIKAITGKNNLDNALAVIDELCAEYYESVIENGRDAGWPIKAVDNELMIKAFYDGDTDANWERQTNDGAYVLKDDFARIDSYYNMAQTRAVDYPDYIENFEECEYRAAYCCWVQDRQAGDNNGNCNTPYDTNCEDADPGDNTDLCYVDMENAPGSARVAGGYAIFPDDTEGDIHCHGLAWGNDVGLDDVYKGNNLFYVAMYDHLYQRGYVRNVPGAPMCGCAEQMPIVSRADCTEMDITQTVRYSWVNQQLSVRALNVNVDFNACNGANNNNNDLEAYYERLKDEGRADEEELKALQERLVGDCDGPIADLVDSL